MAINIQPINPTTDNFADFWSKVNQIIDALENEVALKGDTDEFVANTMFTNEISGGKPGEPATLTVKTNVTFEGANNILGFVSNYTIAGANTTHFILTANNVTGKLRLASKADIGGANSGLDADLLDGQHGDYYLDAANFTGKLPNSLFPSALPAANGSNLTSLTASNLVGTLPNSVFPATLPAINGSNINNLDISKADRGTLSPDRVPAGTFVPTGTILDFAGSTAPAGYLICAGQAVSRTTYADLFAVIGTTYSGGNGSTTFNLPDLRGRVIAGIDNMGGSNANRLGGVSFSTTGLGGVGGSSTVTLTTNQIPSHSHSGTTAASGSHNHTGTTTTNGNHSHSGWTDAQGSHTHSGWTDVQGNHAHAVPTTIGPSQTGPAGYSVAPGPVANPATYSTTASGQHSHNVSTNAAGSHTHNVGMSANGDHAHTFTTSTAANHTHTFTTESTGSGQAHENVQPTMLMNKIIKT